jgi:hypothetical protein
VERRTCSDDVDGLVGKRNRLRGSCDRLRLGNGALEHRAHRIAGLDGDDVRAEPHELSRELPRPCAQIEDAVQREALRDPRESLARISRTRALVDLGDGVEAAAIALVRHASKGRGR